MKSLQQKINEALILELSSDLLLRASRKAQQQGRVALSDKFWKGAEEALRREIMATNYKPGPNAKNCGEAVAATKEFMTNTPEGKKMSKAMPDKKLKTIKFPVLEKTSGDKYKFIKYRDVKIPQGAWYIYKDTYHGKKKIACLSDMIGMIGFAYWDFEDFDASYVIAAFDTLQEAAQYAVNMQYNLYNSEEFIDAALNDDDGSYELGAYWDGACATILDTVLEWADLIGEPTEIEGLPED